VKRLRTLLITFENEIPYNNMEAFRGAIIEKAGKEHILFHNHLGDTFSYRYPLIQYKLIRKKPAIFCVESGVDVIHHLFENKTWQININGSKVDLKVGDLNLKTTTLNVWEKDFHYNLINWQALNDANFQRFMQSDSLTERIGLLEKILTGNLLSMAKGLDWRIEKKVIVKITDIESEKLKRMKEIKVVSFNVRFSSNIFLPDYLGIGKGASKGFGILRQIRNRENE
jgi:hypothetical protein